MKKLITIYMVIVLLSVPYTRAGTWTILDCPGAGGEGTAIYDISGNVVIGTFSAGISYSGFIYDGTNWSYRWKGDSTIMTGISGDNIVGGYQDTFGNHGFLYDGTNWTTLDYPGTSSTSLYGTTAYGIDGSNIVGEYDASGFHGFLYDGITWTTLDVPGAWWTVVRGISGKNIVGYYGDTHLNQHGFIYDMTSEIWTTIDNELGIQWTNITAIDGTNLVGSYLDNVSGFQGFLYNMTTQNWTTIQMPNGRSVRPLGISGNKIVGECSTDYYGRGFIYEIPEPATLFLLGLGGLTLLRKRRK